MPGFKTACFKSKEEANTFARRLVASFNATRHVPVETLETDPLTLDGVEDTFNRLKAQNAQLLEALKKIDGCQADGIAPDDPGGWMDFFIETARAAISAATKTGTNQQTEPDYDNPAEYEADQREASEKVTEDKDLRGVVVIQK